MPHRQLRRPHAGQHLLSHPLIALTLQIKPQSFAGAERLIQASINLRSDSRVTVDDAVRESLARVTPMCAASEVMLICVPSSHSRDSSSGREGLCIAMRLLHHANHVRVRGERLICRQQQ